MSTTSLFVERVVIGVAAGGCFWALWALMVTELHRIAEHANALKD